MRSMSLKSKNEAADRPMTTPSTTVETDGSTPSEKLSVPMPRIDNPCPRVLALLVKLIEGETCESCSRPLIRLSASTVDESTATETGTFCRLCSRFCAVTTISPLGVSPSAAALS